MHVVVGEEGLEPPTSAQGLFSRAQPETPPRTLGRPARRLVRCVQDIGHLGRWIAWHGGTLTEQQVHQITTYVRSLKPEAPSVAPRRKGKPKS